MAGDPSSAGGDDRVGTRFDGYLIESLVGVGGMGRVYRARTADGEAVALKVVKPDLARDETFRRRFAREARIAQTVRNPHVVAVRAAGEHDGLPYLAAEFIDGTTLDERLEREGPLDVAATVRVCAEVAEGLQALWEAGMVHRDVKPANILLDAGGSAYITDFGLAKDRDGTVLTRPGQPLGSMDYMAPEQIRGEPVTAASDVYALGCVTYECLSGRPPFADREGMGVLWAHLQEEPPELVRDDVSAELAGAVMAALRKQPEERPATSVDYARALSEAAGVPISGPRGGGVQS
jgi:serine/threonine-protein kinase